MYNIRVDVNARPDGPVDDRAALAASLEGDGDAFGVLVERYQQIAFRTAYLIVRDAQTAEDVCQEGFLRAHDNLHRFRIDDPFRPWLLRIVKNLALNHVRSRGRREGLLTRLLRASPATTAVEAGPERTAEAREQSDLLLRALDELREDDRVVLYLRHFLDLPEDEIAGVIGKRPGTVKSRLSRAHGRLRELIERRYPELRPSGASVETAGAAESGGNDG